MAASQNGDWDSSRRHWAKAVVNADLAGTPEAKMAALNYEYGRSLGVTCFFEESEKYLNLAYQQDSKTGGPAYNDLVELARLNLDQKKWVASIAYFKKALPILKQINAPTEAPYAYADILSEYADALDAVGSGDAANYRNQAESIKKNRPDGYSITDRTPYGTQCTN